MAILVHHLKGFAFSVKKWTARLRRLGRAVPLALAGWLLVLEGAVGAQPTPPAEYELKAAFLYNFLLFVEWPAEAFATTNSPIRIGIVGTDPFGPVLDQALKDKTVNGRSVTLVRLKNRAETAGCHLVFVSQSERRQMAQILGTLGTNSVLTVSEQERFVESGGMVNFIMEAKKVRFEINLAAAERSRLKIDPKLLKLATAVRQAGPVPKN